MASWGVELLTIIGTPSKNVKCGGDRSISFLNQLIPESMKEIHDGNLVRIALNKSGMTNKEFAKKLGVAPSTLSRMLNNDSWRTGQLHNAGELLGVNFFEEYAPFDQMDFKVIGVIVEFH